MKSILPLALILTFTIGFTACKKEEVEILPEKEERVPETNDPAISNTAIKMFSQATLYGDVRGCSYYGLASFYSWEINYRFAEGYSSGDKVFYPLEKNWAVKYRLHEYEEGYIIDTPDEWDKAIDWTETDYLYRYDPNEKLALIYDGETDENPKTLMNFNMTVGDTWTLMNEGQVRYEVIETFEFESNGNHYPGLVLAVKTGYGKRHLTINSESKTFVVTPLNPNPMQTVVNYYEILHPKWEIFKTDAIPNEPHFWIPDFTGHDILGAYTQYMFTEWTCDESVNVNDLNLNGAAHYYEGW